MKPTHKDQEGLFRSNGAAESTNARVEQSANRDKAGFPETITIVASPRIIRPGQIVDRILRQRRQWKEVFKARKMEDSTITEDQIAEGLRSDEEALDGIVRLEFEGRKPTLVLPSGLQRAKLMEVLNKESYVPTYELENNELWGPDIENPGVSIVEGVLDVAQDDQILAIENNREKALQWLKNLEERGLTAISGVQQWVMLYTWALAQGKPIAVETSDVLNAQQLKKLEETALLGVGYFWDDDRCNLRRVDPDDSRDDLRLRASVGVDVPKA